MLSPNRIIVDYPYYCINYDNVLFPYQFSSDDNDFKRAPTKERKDIDIDRYVVALKSVTDQRQL